MSKKQQQKAQAHDARAVLVRELEDPARLVVHLKHLSMLLSGMEELRVARIPLTRLLDAVLGLPKDALASVPEAERPLKLREQLIPGLIDDALGKACRTAFDQALGRAKEQNDRIALFAGRMFIDSWLRNKEKPQQNPGWEGIFGISLLDAVFEGHLLSKIVRASWDLDEKGIASQFAKALARAEVAKELEGLGLAAGTEPAALAKQYVALAKESGRTYLLGFDALLYLVRANTEFAAAHVKTLVAEGANAAVRQAALDAFEGAYREDVTKPLMDDLASEISRRLQKLAKGLDPEEVKAKKLTPEDLADEKRTGLLALLSIRAIPIDKSAFLRNTYLGSFDVYKNVAPAEEVPFIRKIWSEPGDRFALEEFEKYLIERRHSHRAGRVRRYLAALRAEAKEKAGG